MVDNCSALKIKIGDYENQLNKAREQLKNNVDDKAALRNVYALDIVKTALEKEYKRTGCGSA